MFEARFKAGFATIHPRAIDKITRAKRVMGKAPRGKNNGNGSNCGKAWKSVENNAARGGIKRPPRADIRSGREPDRIDPNRYTRGISKPSRGLRATNAAACSSPTIFSAFGSHLMTRFNRAAIAAKWQVPIA